MFIYISFHSLSSPCVSIFLSILHHFLRDFFHSLKFFLLRLFPHSHFSDLKCFTYTFMTASIFLLWLSKPHFPVLLLLLDRFNDYRNLHLMPHYLTHMRPHNVLSNGL